MRIPILPLALASLAVASLTVATASAQVLGPADTTTAAKSQTDTLVAHAVDTSTKTLPQPEPQVTWGNCLGTTMDILRGTRSHLETPFRRLE